MKRIHIFLIPLLVLALTFPLSAVGAENGVDDLRGRWNIQWNFQGEGSAPQLILYINALRASTTLPNTYYANGCMRSPDTNALMPLSVRAVFDPDTKSYQVIFLSTFIPQDNEPFVIRLNGSIQPNGESVKDDQSQGTLVTEFTTGQWTGLHHDRRETKCPSVRDSGLSFQGDVYVHRELGYSTPRNWVLYEGHTVIVSSGMLVEAPDGTSFVVQEYTDIFSPDVDFVGRFRYLLHTEGLPIIGGVYKFSLLDIFGEPIPGTESTDIWYSCPQGAPSNIDFSYQYEDHALMTWDPVAAVPGQFDPASQIGFYQISIWPFNWQGNGDYGSNGIASPSHVIPWNQFEPGVMGQPDGYDFGTSLANMPDGIHYVGLEAFGVPAPGVGGAGHECSILDSSESFTMTKTGSDLSFEQMASISGQVTDAAGLPISGAGVGACPYDEENPTACYGDQTDADGNYTIFLPAGGYRVNGGGMEGWSNEFYNDTPDWNLASEVNAYSGLDTPNIDFSLFRVTTISGTVYDAEGNPLPNIAVDTEFGGYGTCTDENGQYTLQNIPLEAHFNIVAGRDFCGDHPYTEQTVFDVAAGSTDVNFFLNMDNGYYPTLHVVPAYPEIHGHGWNPEATVTIFVDDDDNLGNGFLYKASKLVTDEPTWCGEPCFDVSGLDALPFGILPGYVVTMMDNEAIHIVHVTNLVWTGTDTEADTVFGTAAPGAWVEVRSHGPFTGLRLVQADENGDWIADFSIPGIQDFEQDILDLEPGFHGRSIQFEGGIPDDGTLAYWNVN